MPIEELKMKRKSLKATLTRFKTFLTKFNPESDDIEEIEARLVAINDIINKFTEIQSEINDHENNDDTTEITNFEDSFFAAIGTANKLINNYKLKNSLNQFQGQTNQASPSNIHSSPTPNEDRQCGFKHVYKPG